MSIKYKRSLDISGLKFNKLKVIKEVTSPFRQPSGQKPIAYLCECGKETIIRRTHKHLDELKVVVVFKEQEMDTDVVYLQKSGDLL